MKLEFGPKIQRKLSNLLAIFGLVFFAYFVFRFGHKYYHLEYHGRQTQGTVDLIGEDWRYDKEVVYSYSFRGKKYVGQAWYDEEISPKVGDTFQVIFSEKNPEISKLVFRD